MKNIYVLLFFFSLTITAQIKGVVKDSITQKPIAFVSIYVKNENISITSEEDGTFQFKAKEIGKQLLFSAIGYENKTVTATSNLIVFLQPKNYELDDVVIDKKAKRRLIEIGKTDNTVAQAFDTGPKIDTKFFPYYSKYDNINLIKQLIFSADCKIDEALVKFHFYKLDSNSFPGEEMLDQNLIVTVNKGVKSYKVDLTKYNLYLPKQGIFVGVEKLNIEKNKLEKVIFNENTQTTILQTIYCPMILYNYIDRPFSFSYSGGNWIKKENTNPDNFSNLIRVFEPEINLILTN
jgi:hypothetical protein